MQWRTLLTRLLGVLAVAVVFPLFIIVADHAWSGGLARPVIVGAGLVWLGAVVVASLGLSVVILWRRVNPVFAAQELERAGHIHHNTLINTLLLRRMPETAYAHAAATRQAARDVRRHPPIERVEPGGQRVWLGALCVALAAWVVYAAVAPKPVLPSLARFCGADVAAPTATVLELVLPRATDVVHAREALEIEFALTGRAVEDVWFEFNSAVPGPPAPVVRYSLKSRRWEGDVECRRIALAPHEVRADIRFSCRAGDALLEGVIPVQPQPAVRSLSIRLDPPAYTGEPAATASEPDLHVWAGTQATFAVEANVAIHEPVLVLVGDPETRTRMSGARDDPRSAAVTVALTESCAYRIEFADRWGYALRHPPQHRIVVRTDAAPQIEVLTPDENEAPGRVVDVTQVPAFKVEATDDVHVERIVFVVERGEDVSRRAIVSSVADETGRRRVVARFALDEVGLEPGQHVRAWFEVRDNRVLPDGVCAPQRGRTLEYALTMPLAPPETEPPQKDSGQPESGQQEPGDEDAGESAHECGEGETTDAGEGTTGGHSGERNEEQADAPDQGGQAQDGSSAPGEEASQGDTGAQRGDDAAHQADPGAAAPERGGGRNGQARDAAEPQDDGAPDGQPGADGTEEQLEQEFRRFLEQYGREAREVVDRMRAAEGEGGGEEEPDAQQPQQGGAQSPAADQQQGDTQQSGAQQSQQPAGTKPDGQEQQQGGGEEEPDAQQQQQGGAQSPTAGQREAGQSPGAGQQQGSGQQSPGGQPQQGDGTAGGQPGNQAGADSNAEGAAQTSSEAPGTTGQAPGSAGGSPGAGVARGTGSEQAREPAGGVEQGPPADHGEEPGGLAGDGEQLDSRGRIEALDALELLERAEDPPDDVLEDLGWSPARRDEFTHALRRLQQATRRIGGAGELRRLMFDAQLGDDERQRGRDLSADASLRVRSAQTRDDALRRIAPPAEQAVPPALRPLLDAYYRSLAARRGESPPDKAAENP
ncbi:MAG: hypothetical protein KKB50_11605 [Planctomycetes bacterium]|nr:hypothetical protein [Planctomycetota bacterium]